MNDNGTLSIFFVVIAALLSWLLWIISSHILRNRATTAQLTLQMKLIDQLASTGQLVDLTKNGMDNVFATVADGRRNGLERVLDAVRSGCICCCLGCGCFVVRWSLGGTASGTVALTMGTLLVALGLGFLLTAFFSRRMLESSTDPGNPHNG